MSTIYANNPSKNPIVCFQRSTFALTLIFYDDEDKTIPSDLGGSSFRMEVRDKADNVILEFSTDTDGGMTIEDNMLHIDKTADEMDVEPGTYKYDLNETNYEGDEIPHMYDDFIINKKQTQPASA